jgi:D-3-phosphoglycerate dehydrogenase
MDIKKVLVADAVDAACVKLLEKHSIQVDCKYKLPVEQLIAEIKVRVDF